MDAHGDLFIGDQENFVVEEVTPAGRLSVVAGDGNYGQPKPGPATKTGLSGPNGVAVDTHGDLFIADLENNVVEEVTPTGRLSVVAGLVGQEGPPTPGPASKSELYSGPFGLAVDAHGDLFIADRDANFVEEVTPAGRLSVVAGDGSTGPPTPGPATKSALDSPAGLAVDAHGDLFVTEQGNNVVDEVNPAGRLSVVAGVVDQPGPPTPGPATKSKLSFPTGLALSAHGDLFICDYGNNLVDKVTF